MAKYPPPNNPLEGLKILLDSREHEIETLKRVIARCAHGTDSPKVVKGLFHLREPFGMGTVDAPYVFWVCPLGSGLSWIYIEDIERGLKQIGFVLVSWRYCSTEGYSGVVDLHITAMRRTIP